jgi:subtilisin family serine protease
VNVKRRRSLLNYEATEVVQGGELAGVNTETPFYDAGIDGTGQVVGSGDSGLDDRHCAFSASGKVAMKRSTTGDYADFSGHGTHVVGSIVGSLTDDGSGSKYDGVAKGASVAFTDMGTKPRRPGYATAMTITRPLTRPMCARPRMRMETLNPHIMARFQTGKQGPLSAYLA